MDHKEYLRGIGSKGGKANSPAQKAARAKTIAKVNARRKKSTPKPTK
jgi:hypothetical protein